MASSDTLHKATACINRIYSKCEDRVAAVGNNSWLKAGIWTLVIFLLFAILLALNYFTPMIADDFGYLVVYRENTPIHSLADIVRSQYNHYMLWGGRSVVHFIAQLLLQLPALLADICNTLVYMFYASLIYWHIKGRGAHNLSLFLLVNIAIWVVQPAFGDTMLWIIGSANYLWGTALILLFLLPFRLYRGQVSGISVRLWKGIAFLPFAFLAGWTNENTAGAMIVIAVLFLFYYRSRQWQIPLWSGFAIIGAVVGYVFMIAAPGNALRAGEAGELSVFLIVYRTLMYTSALFVEYGVINLCYLGAIVLLWHFGKTDKDISLKLSLIYFVGMLAGVYAMVFSPSFPPRAWFGVLTFLIIAFGIVFYNLNFESKFIRQLRSVLLVFGSITFCFLVYWAAKDVSAFYAEYKLREQIIANAKQAGQKSCEIKRYVSRSKFVHSEDPTANYLMWDYYGIEVLFEGEEDR